MKIATYAIPPRELQVIHQYAVRIGREKLLETIQQIWIKNAAWRFTIYAHIINGQLKAHSKHTTHAIKFSRPQWRENNTENKEKTQEDVRMRTVMPLIQWTPYLLAYKIYYSSNIIAVACSIFIASWTTYVNSTMTCGLRVYTGWSARKKVYKYTMTRNKILNYQNKCDSVCSWTA